MTRSVQTGELSRLLGSKGQRSYTRRLLADATNAPATKALGPGH